MITEFAVSNGEAVLLLADISFVRHDTANKNTFFRILVDGVDTVAYSNTGNSAGADYRSISFHGVKSGLSIGTHTAELQVQRRARMFLQPFPGSYHALCPSVLVCVYTLV